MCPNFCLVLYVTVIKDYIEDTVLSRNTGWVLQSMCRVFYCLYTSTVKRLIAFKTKVFVYIIYVCVLCIYVMYI